MAVCNKLSALSLLGLALALGAQGAAAQQSFLIDVGPCLGLGTSVERLVCFEQQVREAQALQGVEPALVTRPAPSQPAAPAQPAPSVTRPAPAVPSQPAPAMSAAPRGEAAFGLPEEPAQDSAPEEMFGTVAALREFAPGQYTITLGNGQVWRQMRPDRYALKEGHEVRIYATRWGNAFRLTVKELGGFIQVERVQ